MSRHAARTSRLRATTARLAIGGVAGLASVMVVAPAALAEDAPTTPEPTQTDPSATTPTPTETETPGDDTSEPAPDPTDEPAPDPTDEPAEGAPAPSHPAAGEPKGSNHVESKVETAADEVEPDFGFQKVRVGVQVADGSYVPNGTTTAGTTITITETGPNVEGGSTTTTCDTQADTQEPGSTATYCDFSSEEARLARRAKAADVTVEPDPGGPGAGYFALPGSTLTITQTTVRPHLVRDTSTATITPCEANVGPFCTPQKRVLFNDPGLPPSATDDHATTRENTAVTVDVLDNDDPVDGAPVSGLTVTAKPDDGSAKVKNGKIVYTPDDDFTGTDTFDYRYSTPNGSATATVTVRVRPSGVESEDALLPDTGGADPKLLGYGALLLAGGGWLTARGRRRPGAHASTD